MPSKSQKKSGKGLLALLIIVVIGVGVYFYFPKKVSAIPASETPHNLSFQAGIIKPDGTIVPLNPPKGLLSWWTVNNVRVDDTDILFFQPWLNLTATGVPGALKSVQFTYNQTWQGTLSSWQAGTSSSANPRTDKSESWFQVNLPLNTPIVIPVKFRDNFDSGGGENVANLFPFTTLASDGVHVIRDRRMFRLIEFNNLPDGTYTLVMYLTITQIQWQYTQGGTTQIGTVVPSPNRISCTFNLQKQATAGLAISLQSTSSSTSGTISGSTLFPTPPPVPSGYGGWYPIIDWPPSAPYGMPTGTGKQLGWYLTDPSGYNGFAFAGATNVATPEHPEGPPAAPTLNYQGWTWAMWWNPYYPLAVWYLKPVS